jgi:hypothetical protein
LQLFTGRSRQQPNSAAIHAFLLAKAWMPATSAGMTEKIATLRFVEAPSRFRARPHSASKTRVNAL